MFRYSLFLDTLFKALTHKYIRRVPKGVTKTGATKYMYFYAGQEGHGKGIGHESELVTGASFAFGEHGKTRYHAHISKVDGDKLTIKYDDGDKKGTEETMTKKQFQSMIHGEHSTSIQSAKEKATKQLKDFQAGKEKGVKVKQETLDKLEQRVKNLDALTAKKEEAQKPEAPIQMIKDYFANAFSSSVRVKLSHVISDMVKLKRPDMKYKPIKITEDMLMGAMSESQFKRIFDTQISLAFHTIEKVHKDLLNSPIMLAEFGTSESTRGVADGVFSVLMDKLANKKFITSTLLDIAQSIENGTQNEDAISDMLEKKMVDESNKILATIKDDLQKETKSVQVDTIKPSEQKANAFVKTLDQFVSKSKEKHYKRFTKITIDPKTKTVLSTDGSLALLVKNPKGFDIDDQLQNITCITPEQVKEMKKDKSAKIVLNVNNTDRSAGVENENMIPVIEQMLTPSKQQKAVQISDDFRNRIMSLRVAPNSRLVFKKTSNDDSTFEVFHEYGKFQVKQNIKIADVSLESSNSEKTIDDIGFSLEYIKQVLPLASKMYLPNQPNKPAIFDGVDENTKALVMPRAST